MTVWIFPAVADGSFSCGRLGEEESVNLSGTMQETRTVTERESANATDPSVVRRTPVTTALIRL
ncbi:MAG: hypothetical protein HY593_06205 [Candidatus Omnitrophica bacterium]|nr:hypothetical protein [Candidatus Omnitrophota bacterium]